MATKICYIYRVSITFDVGAWVSQSQSGGHYKGLCENQATFAGSEWQICYNKDGGKPPVAGF